MVSGQAPLAPTSPVVPSIELVPNRPSVLTLLLVLHPDGHYPLVLVVRVVSNEKSKANGRTK